MARNGEEAGSAITFEERCVDVEKHLESMKLAKPRNGGNWSKNFGMKMKR
jgi:hypothetical protein